MLTCIGVEYASEMKATWKEWNEEINTPEAGEQALKEGFGLFNYSYLEFLLSVIQQNQ